MLGWPLKLWIHDDTRLCQSGDRGRGLLLRSECLLVPTFLCLTSDRWGSYPWTMDVPVLCWCCRGTLNGGLDTSEPAVYAKWHSETTLA